MSHSTFNHFFMGQTVNPNTVFFILPTSVRQSVCLSSHYFTLPLKPGCVPSRVPPVCARWCTSMRYLATCHRQPIRRQKSRCCACLNRLVHLVSGWLSPRRTRSISITRVCPMPAPGSSDDCKQSVTKNACWMDCKAQVMVSLIVPRQTKCYLVLASVCSLLTMFISEAGLNCCKPDGR